MKLRRQATDHYPYSPDGRAARAPSRVRRTVVMVLAASMCAGAAGCGGGDDAERVVQEMSTILQGLSVSGTSPAPSVTHRVDSYNRIIRGLEPIAGSGLPGQAGAANMMIARSRAGLAEIQAAAAAEAERRTLNRVSEIRAQIDTMLNHEGLAASLETFDPAVANAQIDSAIQDKEREIAQTAEQQRRLEARVAELTAQIDQAAANARAAREQEAQVRGQAVAASATVRANLIEQATVFKRQADGFEKQGSLLQAEVAMIAPEVSEAQSRSRQLGEQRSMLAAAKSDVQRFKAINTDRAGDARRAAASAAAVIADQVSAMEKSRAELPALSEQAASGFARAVSAANAAARNNELARDARDSAKVAAASYLHAKADVLATNARGLQAVVGVFESLSATSLGSQFAAQAAGARTAYDKARQEAIQAYDEAKSAYEGVGGRQEVKDRLAAVGASLTELLRGGTSAAASERAAGTSEATAGAAPMGGTSDEDAIRAAIDALLAAADGDNPSVALELINLRGVGSQMLADLAVLPQKISVLDEACKAKFGRTFTEIAAAGGGVDLAGMLGDAAGGSGLVGMLGDLDGVTSADFDIRLTGPETAEVSQQGGPAGDTLKFVKVGGRWRLEVEVPAEVEEQLAPMAPLIKPLGEVFDQLARDVNAGRFANEQELVRAFSQRMLPLMMRMGGPPGGGG